MKCYSRFILLSFLLFTGTSVNAKQEDRARMELIKRMDNRLDKITYCMKDADNYLKKVNDTENNYRRIFTISVCLDFYEQIKQQGKLNKY